MYFDSITIVGNISKINNSENDKFIWFDICKNEKYKDKSGEVKDVASFFSAKIDRTKIKDNNLFKVGSWVSIYGIPKSYIDKNNQRKFYIHTLKLENAKEYTQVKKDNILTKINPNISCDSDGVMLWNEKRCEVSPIAKEEQEELEVLLSEY